MRVRNSRTEGGGYAYGLKQNATKVN